ncbi:hypothetical protein AB0346_01005 [Nocardia beijingensis]|uniref:hypothetical protein n=1 Tax=Nocardia beijingensis TaxID=95162 RepID=UPI00344F8140
MTSVTYATAAAALAVEYESRAQVNSPPCSAPINERRDVCRPSGRAGMLGAIQHVEPQGQDVFVTG